MGLSALPNFSKRHRVPTENRNEDGKPGAFAPQRQVSLACMKPLFSIRKSLSFLRHGSNERDSASSTRKVQPCHPERSEGSRGRPRETLRFAQGDTVRLFKRSRTFRPH